MRTGVVCVLFVLLAWTTSAGASPAVTPLDAHPGNVVLQGMPLKVRLPEPPRAAGPAEPAWQATDYEGNVVKEGRSDDGLADLGPLPVGYYEVSRKGATARTTAAVLAPLVVRPALESPIGVDVAMAWFYKKEQMAAVANLCALLGASRVRDRLHWGLMEPAAGAFAPSGVYDDSAQAQAAAGLAVLQVNHLTSKWAGPDEKRFPPDLRDAYRFYRAMAQRWRGQVVAFEPWNEADIEAFGGHPGSEMASFQKASYLGLKAGNPDVIACMNVLATNRAQTLADLDANEVSPYFDTFNFHHYGGIDTYPEMYASFRRVADARPMWVTEFQMPLPWEGDPQAKELSDENLRLQAQRLPMMFAAGLHEGPAAMFYFAMPQYSEGQTQFGLLHGDLTPRPAFVALAAVGRLLAQARPAGRLDHAPAGVSGYLFHAKPDGAARVVLVAWAAAARDLDLPVAPLAIFDHLGRPRPVQGRALSLGPKPIYVVLPEDVARRFQVATVKAARPRVQSPPSPIVLQVLMDRKEVSVDESALRVSSQRPTTLALFAYNFSDKPARGSLRVAGPSEWRIAAPPTIELAPGERKAIDLTLDCNGSTPDRVATLGLAADMGALGRAVLSFRVMPQPRIVPAAKLVPLKGAGDVKRFTPDAAPGSKVTLGPCANGMSVEATLTHSDRWIYPRIDLQPSERAPAGAKALRMRVKAIEGHARFHVLFVKANGAMYIGGTVDPQPQPGETRDLIVDIAPAGFGKGFSPPDPEGRVTPASITALKIGCNTSDDRVRYEISDVAWVK